LRIFIAENVRSGVAVETGRFTEIWSNRPTWMYD